MNLHNQVKRWKISLRDEFSELRPGEIKESQEYFLDDSSLSIHIAIVFGAKVLEHVLNLCRGNYDFLKQLPVPLLLHIISFLELKDIARLSQVSSRLEMVKKTIKIKYIFFFSKLLPLLCSIVGLIHLMLNVISRSALLKCKAPVLSKHFCVVKLSAMSKPLSNDSKSLLLSLIMIPSLLVEICNSNALWENTVGNLCSMITPEMKELAQEMAWNGFFLVFSYSCSLEGGGRNKPLRTKTN
ncbi:LOW QUALITY PROTEIN: F-box only protein 36 [Ara ararauna]